MNIDKGKFLRSLIAIGLLGGAACGKKQEAREVEVTPPPPTAGAEAVEQKPAEPEAPQQPTVIVQPIEVVPVPVAVPVEAEQMEEEEAKPDEMEELGPTPE